MSQLVAVIVSFFLLLNQPEIHSVRNTYKKAIYSEKETEHLLKVLKPIDQNDPLLYAYKGALTAVSAKFAANPYSKLERVKSGAEMLDLSVIKSPNNIEIRYLRYSIETNVPAFLPYRTHLKQDEARIVLALMNSTSGLSEELISDISLFMLEHADLSLPQRTKLKSLTR